jgi:hypothetical protein
MTQRRIKLASSSLFLYVLLLSWVQVVVLQRGMQHGDLDKTRVLKTKIVSISDVRKQNFKSVLKSVTLVRPVLNTGQTGWTYPSACPASYPDSRDSSRTCPAPRLDISSPQPGHIRPNIIPQRLSPRPDISSPKPGSREGGRTYSAPDPDMSGFLTPQRLVF